MSLSPTKIAKFYNDVRAAQTTFQGYTNITQNYMPLSPLRCFCFYPVPQYLLHKKRDDLAASTCDDREYEAFSLMMSWRSAAAAAHRGSPAAS